MRKITVNVTQEDIDDGIPEEPCDCPIALALRRTLGPESEASVDVAESGPDAGHAYVGLFDQPDVRLPDACRQFIENFDTYGRDTPEAWTPQPFSFELEVPECA